MMISALENTASEHGWIDCEQWNICDFLHGPRQESHSTAVTWVICHAPSTETYGDVLDW